MRRAYENSSLWSGPLVLGKWLRVEPVLTDDLSVTAFLLRNHFSQRGMHSQGQETKWLISGSGGGIGEEKTINWRLTSKGSDLSGNGGP